MLHNCLNQFDEGARGASKCAPIVQ